MAYFLVWADKTNQREKRKNLRKRRLAAHNVDQEQAELDKRMNISKADAIAHLAKWFDAGTQVRATYKTITGNSFIVGKITDLSSASIKVTGSGCEMMLHFRTTSEYDYKDARQPASEVGKNRENKYPTIIDVKFSNGDHLDIMEFFDD